VSAYSPDLRVFIERHDPTSIGLFTAACAIVAGLTLIAPEHARWIALGLLAVVFVASAIPRRPVHPSHKRREARVRGDGSGF